jgi:hypothetical protein
MVSRCTTCYQKSTDTICMSCAHAKKYNSSWFARVEGSKCKVCGSDDVYVWTQPISTSHCVNGHKVSYNQNTGDILSIDGKVVGNLMVDYDTVYNSYSELVNGMNK